MSRTSQPPANKLAGDIDSLAKQPAKPLPRRDVAARAGPTAHFDLGAIAVNPPPSEAAGSPSSGQALDASTRAFFEPRLGQDFSQVRIHTETATSVDRQGARALTRGEHIFFGSKQFSPETLAGRHLLAHELTHVAQQHASACVATEPTGDMQHNAAEHEASQAAATLLTGRPARASTAIAAGTVQLSPISDQVDDSLSKGNKDHVFDVLRAQGPLKPDPDLNAVLDKTFGPNTDPATITDNRWLADQIIQFGPEPHWSNAALLEREKRAHGHHWGKEAGNIEGKFDVGANRQTISAFYFPGTSDKRAMIIGGVHGDETAGVDVVNRLLAQMTAAGAATPFYSVIIVPKLFADNVDAKRRKTPGEADPNRQMPKLGQAVDPSKNQDSEGRQIEPENLLLLDLIERFKPERIASVHGHGKKGPGAASITSDPRPGEEAGDNALALKMAHKAKGLGARLPGNKLDTKKESATYPTDKSPHEKGVSFGNYASHATTSRPAMNAILIETLGKPVGKLTQQRTVELEALASVLDDIFLGPP
ncbi:eCIS core domain-containing protein [Dyella silvatica]|uniref:eCIS core domain-containing protein n=1 Tax=Dyella silvatica TaxID=2992128 RepID=UPI002256C57F|nr:DUF4157 domain-containing protein [Dyella silvatica]